MGRLRVLLAVLVGFVLGLVAGLTRAPMFTVYEFAPESVSTPIGGGTIPASMAYYDGHKWIVSNGNEGIPIGSTAASPYTIYEGLCSDGIIWRARSDGSCWMADKPKW